MKNKKIILSFLALSGILSANSKGDPINKLPIFGPKGLDIYQIEYDVSQYPDRTTIYSFQGQRHRQLGKISRTEDSIVYGYMNYTTYKSGWNLLEKPTTIKMPSNRYDTYTFAKYVDLPIEVYHTRRMAPGTSSSFTIETTKTEAYSQEKTVEVGNKVYAEYFKSYTSSLGGGVNLSFIIAETEKQYSSSMKVGAEMTTTVTETAKSTTSFSIVYKETFQFDNSSSDEYRYFQLNQRQKYKVYFTTNFGYIYNVTTTTSGLGGLDKHYSYEFKNYTGICTKFFLIPVDNPYFEMSIYYDSTSGTREYEGNSHQSIYYI